MKKSVLLLWPFFKEEKYFFNDSRHLFFEKKVRTALYTETLKKAEFSLKCFKFLPPLKFQRKKKLTQQQQH